jgi:hypothetical protein
LEDGFFRIIGRPIVRNSNLPIEARDSVEDLGYGKDCFTNDGLFVAGMTTSIFMRLHSTEKCWDGQTRGNSEADEQKENRHDWHAQAYLNPKTNDGRCDGAHTDNHEEEYCEPARSLP